MKFRFDRKGLDFKLWTYFALFALLTMVILWNLQIFLMPTYYQSMKIHETAKVASSIAKQYGDESFLDTISEISITNDMYIHIETLDGSIIFSPATEERLRSPYAYIAEMQKVRADLLASGKNETSAVIPVPRTNANILVYASYLDDSSSSPAILYIFSPLYPVSSTVSILREQLIHVTAISLLLAFGISFYLSRRITRPIREITDSAKSLAEGNYGIRFKGGPYTEITDLADMLNYTSTRLEKADTLQKDLMANVSHDLKTPLTMIKSYAEMIRDISGNEAEKRGAHLNVIIEEADRLNLLVNDILLLSRVQSGALPVEKSVFDMSRVIENIAQSYALLCERDGYTLELQCAGGATVKADRAKLEQVVTNLINNAVKYGGNDKTVIISVKVKSGTVRCEITDNGVGIPQSEISQIWERYYKASTNHVRGTSGTGLGLAIVKEILLLHDAGFGAVSEPGKGSTFWFELPFCESV